jgi:outer membrane protein TolC
VSRIALPTGGAIDVTWENSAYRRDIGVAYAYTSGWSARFTQPLLKGGGIDNATYAVKTARIAEEQNILTLKQTIADRIGTAISNFRTYASAIRTLENRRKALENARQTYEINQALVAAGRMARTELIQSEADIANREFDVVSARNDLDSARLTLLSFLNIDKQFVFTPVDESEIRVPPPLLEEAVEIALKNRTDYLSALYTHEVRKLTLKTATRNRMWALDLTGGTEAGKTSDGETFAQAFGNQNISKRNWDLKLSLAIPLSWLTDDRKAYLMARNEVEKGEWSLKKMRSDIEISIQNAIRNVDMQYRRLELARQARKLSEQKLEIENEKLKAGRTTNFQLVSFQNDLKTQQDAERDAIKNYLDSLNQLDAQLGTTLDRWNIKVRQEDDVIRITESDRREAEEKLSELNRTQGSPERKGP